MKKIIFTIVLATTTIMTTLALSSVMVMADSTTYNIGDATNLVIHEYDDTNPSEDEKVLEDIVLDCGFESKYKVTVMSRFTPAVIGYSQDLKGKAYLTEAPTEGLLAGTVLNHGVIGELGATSIVTIDGIKEGDIIGVYYYGANAKGVPGKAVNLVGTDETGDRILIGDTRNDDPSSKTVAYTSGIATSDGIITIGGNGQDKLRVGIAAVVIISNEENPFEGLTLVDGLGALYDDGIDTYVIAGFSEDEINNSEMITLKTGSISHTSSTVYESIKIEDNIINAVDVNFDYIFAIKIANTNGADNISFTKEIA